MPYHVVLNTMSLPAFHAAELIGSWFDRLARLATFRETPVKARDIFKRSLGTELLVLAENFRWCKLADILIVQTFRTNRAVDIIPYFGCKSGADPCPKASPTYVGVVGALCGWRMGRKARE